MLFFKLVDVPERIYLWEALHWIAFAQVPEFRPQVHHVADDDPSASHGDMRENIHGHITSKGASEIERFSFSTRFVAKLFPDENAYQVAAFLNGDSIRTVQEAKDILRRVENTLKKLEKGKLETDNGDEPKQSVDFLTVAYWEAKLEDAKRYAPIVNRLKSLKDEAIFKLLPKLREGSIHSSGTQPFVVRNVEYGRLLNVPTDQWFLDTIHWEKSNLNTNSGPLYGVTLDFQDLIQCFPPEAMEFTEKLSVHELHDAVVHAGPLSTANSQERFPSSRKLAGGKIEEAVCEIWSKRFSEGDVPSKKEAIIAEVQEFAQTRFGQSISRGTAQNYLKSALESG